MRPSEIMAQMLKLRDESRAILHEKGRVAAADHLSSEQYKLIGVMLDDGQINAKQAVMMIAAVDGYKAEFLARGEE